MGLFNSKITFLFNFIKLIDWAYKKGYQPVYDEYIDLEVRKKKYKGKLISKIIRSRHQTRLKFDLDLLYQGKPITEEKEFRSLAKFWKSLNPRNYSGKDFGWKPNHFEMEIRKPKRTYRPLREVKVHVQIY